MNPTRASILTHTFRGTSTALAVRVVGIVTQLVNMVVIVRMLGSAAFGTFTLVFTIATIAGALVVGGTDVRAAREIGARWTADGSAVVRGFIRVNAFALVITTAVVVAAMTLLGKPLLQLLNAQSLRHEYWLVVLIVVLMGWNAAIVGWLLGLRNVLLQVGMKGPFLYGFSVVYLVSMAFATHWRSETLVLVALCLALATNLTMGLVVVWRTIGGGASERWSSGSGGLLRESFPLLAINLISLAMSWVDVLMVSAFLGPAEVGKYAAASRIAALTSIVLLAVNAVVPPLFAQSYSQGDTEGLAQTAASSARLTLGLTVGIGLGLVFFGKEALALLDPRLGVAAFWVLVILVIGRSIGAASGSVGYLLMMCGEQVRLAWFAAFAVVLNIVTDVILIPRLGIVGAGIGTALTLIAYNLLAVMFARVRLGVWSTSDRLAANVAWGGGAAVIYLLSVRAVGPWMAGGAALLLYAFGAARHLAILKHFAQAVRG